ncbi:PBCV-specific basic adaptor domain [Carpediemonas membranifera]|uniref:PBCV-specific basic adaptor domain n=1 Tax=Carpediemonas membranifera TaxID=201153 RepID=A0A8J6B102_9EUKA|nr:PBCV-specific basic adaptor domain [Carpediemonas membranifera]|eukprot:KAG9390629.1 PBCV-specific basic adaptor domain [Carpediemonas membranifera]
MNRLREQRVLFSDPDAKPKPKLSAFGPQLARARPQLSTISKPPLSPQRFTDLASYKRDRLQELLPDSWDKLDRHFLERLCPMAKRGSRADGTDAAHILAHEVAKECLLGFIGKPTLEEAWQYAIVLNSEDNLTVKPMKENRVMDRRQDAVLKTIISEGGVIDTPDDRDRAILVFRHAHRALKEYPDNTALDVIEWRLGQMEYRPEHGKPRSIRELSKRGIPKRSSGAKNSGQQGSLVSTTAKDVKGEGENSTMERLWRREVEAEKEAKATTTTKTMSPETKFDSKGRVLFIGPRGGVYHVNEHGAKVYHSRAKLGG